MGNMYEDWMKGDRIRFKGRKGVLLTKPEYIVTPRSGLYYADVKWDDLVMVQKLFMVCRVKMVNLSWLDRKESVVDEEEVKVYEFPDGLDDV